MREHGADVKDVKWHPQKSLQTVNTRLTLTSFELGFDLFSYCLYLLAVAKICKHP